MQTYEASTLGLPVGRWPQWLTIAGVQYRLFKVHTDADGDTQYVDYSDGRETIRVFND